MIRLTLLAGVLLGYVIPGEVAIEQVAKRSGFRTPIRVEATLNGAEADWPESITFEIHPDRGVRISDGLGGRWLMRRGRVIAGTKIPAPDWLPQLEILTLHNEDELLGFLRRNGINPDRNELARCGEYDCFVVGGRTGRGQLWLEKDGFGIHRLQLPEGRIVEFGVSQLWGAGRSGVSFPEQIQLLDVTARIATFQIKSAERAPELGDVDFSPRWVQPTQNVGNP